MQFFTIAWTKKRLGSRRIRMCLNDRPVFFAKHTRSKTHGNSWLISSDSKVYAASSSAFCGRLICEKIASSYLLQVPEQETPVFGLKFCQAPPEVKSGRYFRLVLPKSQPYRPLGKDQQLCQLAKTGKADPNLFTTYSSKLPTRMADGRLVLHFGKGLSILTSVKNFLIAGDDDQIIFMIYKSSTGTCSLKFREPLTSIQAFGIAIACIAPNG
jgi:hypothetical protein